MEKDKIANAVYLRWVTIFCLVAIGFICFGIIYYHYEADRIRDEKYDEIDTIAKLKADSIQDWRRNRLADIKRASIGFTTKREMARLLQDPTNPRARATLQILLNINKKDTVYADAFFLGTKGDILQSDNPNPPLVDQATMKAMKLALKDRKGVLSDFFRDPKGIIYIDAIAPVPDNTGQPIAIMVLRSKAAEFLYPLIQSWPTPSKTAETLLVCREGDSVLFLNELRHRPNTALTLRFPLTDTTLPAAQAALGKYGRFFGRDYRGLEVLAVTQPVPDSPWSIVAKVDAEEVLAEVKYRAWVASIIIFLLILIAAGLIISIYRNRREVERKRAEEELKQSEERYRSIFENAQEGIYRSTPEGGIIMANPAVAKIYGYASPKELVSGITDVARQVYVDPKERVKIMQIVEERGLIVDRETQVYRKDGIIIWISLTINAVRDEKGQFLYYEGMIFDITDRKENVERMRKALGATVQAIAVTVETRDPYTAGHQRRVADLARSIATEMKLPVDQIDGIRMAAAIHDLGKISVPAEILSKPTKLTALEFSLIKAHAQTGYDILKDIDFPWPVARIVLEHHERMDGSGYPNGLTGDNLLESRILSVADVVEAMASHRPYRTGLGIDAALEEIEKNRGTLYDHAVADACLRLFREKGFKLEGLHYNQ
jgi:PAS domain S-box-containing protein